MKLNYTKAISAKRGVTLLELTVVILVLLSLISILFVGARAWMRGSDRSASVLLVRSAQQGMRSHCNIMGVEPEAAEIQYTAASGDAAALNTHVFGSNKFVETGLADGVIPTHPADGVTFGWAGTDGDSVPPLGSLYITSSDSFYDPNDSAGW